MSHRAWRRRGPTAAARGGSWRVRLPEGAVESQEGGYTRGGYVTSSLAIARKRRVVNASLHPAWQRRASSTVTAAAPNGWRRARMKCAAEVFRASSAAPGCTSGWVGTCTLVGRSFGRKWMLLATVAVRVRPRRCCNQGPFITRANRRNGACNVDPAPSQTCRHRRLFFCCFCAVQSARGDLVGGASSVCCVGTMS